MVLDCRYVVMILDFLVFDVVVFFFCVGVIVYSFMICYGMNSVGKKFGVIGFGGVGYMVVKFGKVFGFKVIVFSILFLKKEEVLGVFGVDVFVVSKDE